MSSEQEISLSTTWYGKIKGGDEKGKWKMKKERVKKKREGRNIRDWASAWGKEMMLLLTTSTFLAWK